MIIQHIAAFTDGARGGNPAGVVICEALPDAATMQAMAAEIGYSETAFAAPVDGKWRVRYFAPEAEVDFCGHATIALGAALARHERSGTFALRLNRAEITVDGMSSEAEWSAAFRSPPTQTRALPAAALDEILALFGLARGDLDGRIPPVVAHAGMDHPVIALRERARLAAISYDFGQGQELAQRERFCTFALVHAETPQLFHARNPFPFGGVYEDPATGAAAAALAGYLRELAWPAEEPIVIRQGEDMGVPCCLQVDLHGPVGAPVKVSGSVRSIEA
ncbi:putative Phenazine biosynthesis PhzC/PhzF protein [Bradyrhizobium oligotrophicum S58]|uniref:Putative Phenazine biosynthesis PhzC/PhzF protein n=1 Tax=Bradyrhizobium oligotrophicum S58 TaxID=1245469 RepID=M4Z0Z9_9BRAD|nr:PhzF family phenazine biosynthesis protein [Bradyrhizobium oligotrophicum]BAM86768.1 putative Phenazine biosynthesis PhzC/PhzF protein [Bradyrhizobium oligotrophicum S58]